MSFGYVELEVFPSDIVPGDELHVDYSPKLRITHTAPANFQNLVTLWYVDPGSDKKCSVQLPCITKVKISRLMRSTR